MRLQKLAEEELPESQCGFRMGRSCADMIFTVRQLVEKSWEHSSKVFLPLIDLKKAYDSVPREVLWMALRKRGVPEETISLIQSSSRYEGCHFTGRHVTCRDQCGKWAQARLLHGSCTLQLLGGGEMASENGGGWSHCQIQV